MTLYWIPEAAPHRLAMMARPRAGEWLADEIAGWKKAGVDTVVSLLEAHEVRTLELASEAVLCGEHGLSFLLFPIPDRGTPASTAKTTALVDELAARLRDDRAVAIHCRAGIGRSGLLSACVLLRLGVRFDAVFAALSKARGTAVPDTPEQVEWAKHFGATKPSDGAAATTSIGSTAPVRVSNTRRTGD